MEIPLTQFIRPNGVQKQVSTTVSDDCQQGYEAILKSGCRLTAECILPDLVNICIEDPLDGDVDMILVPNGPGLQEKIADMIRTFTVEKYKQWKVELETPAE